MHILHKYTEKIQNLTQKLQELEKSFYHLSQKIL